MFCRKTVAGVDLRAAGSDPPPGGTLPVAPEAASGWTTPVALPWAASRPSGSPRSSLHRPCAPAATPRGCRGQSTSPRPRRCRREVELDERRAQGIEARRGKTCLLGRFSVRRAGRAASTATASAAADPGVVLCVADGIVRIAAGIIRAAVRLSGGIDRLIGVTAGEEKRCDHDRDAEPHGASRLIGAGQWDVRLVDAQGKSAIARSVAGVAISLNSA